MSDCILRCYDARNAKKYGKKMTRIQKIILMVSDPFVHCEFQFSQDCDNVSHSATMQGDDEGVRFKPIDYTIHPERWISLILLMADSQEDRAMTKAEEINGLPYDTIGVTSLATGWNIIEPNEGAYWCSEACAELIKAAYEYGEDFQPDTFSPRGLFIEMFRRLGQ